MENFTLLAGTIFDIMSRILNLYTTNFLLTAIFTLWVIRRVARLFDRL